VEKIETTNGIIECNICDAMSIMLLKSCKTAKISKMLLQNVTMLAVQTTSQISEQKIALSLPYKNKNKKIF
jgi:hypothetical protein